MQQNLLSLATAVTGSMILLICTSLQAQPSTLLYSATRLCTESGKRDGGTVAIELVRDGLAGAWTHHFTLITTSHEADQIPDGENVPATAKTEMSYAQIDSVVLTMEMCREYMQQYENRHTLTKSVADVMVGTGMNMDDYRIVYILRIHETAVIMDEDEFNKVSGMLVEARAQGSR